MRLKVLSLFIRNDLLQKILHMVNPLRKIAIISILLFKRWAYMTGIKRFLGLMMVLLMIVPIERFIKNKTLKNLKYKLSPQKPISHAGFKRSR